MVPKTNANACQLSDPYCCSENTSSTSLQPSQNKSTIQNTLAPSFSLVRRSLLGERFPESAVKYITKSWWSGTQKQYNTINSINLLKTSAPNRHLTHVEFMAFPHDPDLCVTSCLKVYLKKTEPHHGGSQLFLSLHKPFKPVSRNTISRWIKSVLELAGIDTAIFKAHSTKVAAVSCAKPRDYLLTLSRKLPHGSLNPHLLSIITNSLLLKILVENFW